MRNDHTRRTILAGMAGTAAWAATANAQPHTPVIEWNQHMFSSDMGKFPYHPKAAYKPDPTKNPADPLTAYQAYMKQMGIDKAVIVQPEPYGDDHALILSCLHRESPARFKGISLFYPRDDAAPKKLAALVKSEPRIVSTRFHALRGKNTYFHSFAEANVRALWKQAVDLGLIVELHIDPSYAAEAGDAIEAFPGCKVVIDHLAEPKGGTPMEYAQVLELAKYPNVYMKLSGLGSIAADKPNFESVTPFTRRIIKEFTPDRMVWGDGNPHIVDVHMKGYSGADIAKVKGGNFERLLNW